MGWPRPAHFAGTLGHMSEYCVNVWAITNMVGSAGEDTVDLVDDLDWSEEKAEIAFQQIRAGEESPELMDALRQVAVEILNFEFGWSVSDTNEISST